MDLTQRRPERQSCFLSDGTLVVCGIAGFTSDCMGDGSCPYS